jgi:hypothetical protein
MDGPAEAAGQEKMGMASGGSGDRRAASLLAAVATLVLPLALIGFGALDRPSPAPVVAEMADEPPVEQPVAIEPAPPVRVEPPVAVVAPPPAPPPPAPPPLSPFPRWTREESVNFLILGVDRRSTSAVSGARSTPWAV